MGQLVLYSEQKAFKLREDIRLYSDETKAEELITISARSIIDFSAAYDVVDATTGERVGALRRKGLSSILRDEWLILDVDEIELGRINECSECQLAPRLGLAAAVLLCAIEGRQQ